MTITTPDEFTKEQLFADLESDGITIDEYIINNAKNGDGDALFYISDEYYYIEQYDKAMLWYQLAAANNNSLAQTCIGVLYDCGYGVSKDYFLALEWYLKAAAQYNKTAWENIGILCELGYGVPVDKHKALEWYTRSENRQDKVKALTDQGIQLTEQDKNKPIEQLVKETEIILAAAKTKAEDKSKIA